MPHPSKVPEALGSLLIPHQNKRNRPMVLCKTGATFWLASKPGSPSFTGCGDSRARWFAVPVTTSPFLYPEEFLQQDPRWQVHREWLVWEVVNRACPTTCLSLLLSRFFVTLDFAFTSWRDGFGCPCLSFVLSWWLKQWGWWLSEGCLCARQVDVTSVVVATSLAS